MRGNPTPDKQYFVFVDLRKAYNSVPQEAMCIALRMLGVLDALIEIVISFRNGLKGKVLVDGELLDEIEVNYSLRQEYTMAPILFNLYPCVVAKIWLGRVKDVKGMGTYLLYKSDQQIFRRSTRNAQDALSYKGEFDDDVLLAWTRQAAGAVIRAYMNVAKTVTLTVSIPTTMFMVVGNCVCEEEKLPLAVDDELIEWVSEFPYLGS